MIRPLALNLAAGMALLTATLCGVAESFPVVHNEPITVRILGGKNGQPFAHLHLILIGGYDQKDVHDQLFRNEVLTDAHGQVRLPGQLANLPWLQVWVANKLLCESKPRRNSFSVELIRRDGLSTPNRCGTATVEDAPGVFTVFVKGKGKKGLAKTLLAKATVHIPVVGVALATHPVAEDAAQKPADVEPHPLATPPPPVAAVLPAAPSPVPEQAAIKPVESKPVVNAAPAIASVTATTTSITPSPAITPVAAPAPVAVAAQSLASSPAKAQTHPPVRRVAGRPVSHRAKPVLASCPALPPATTSRSESKPATATVAIHKPKPAAGVRQKAAISGKTKAPPNQK
jgi:hypothetical protein